MRKSAIRIQKWWRRIIFWNKVDFFKYTKQLLRNHVSLEVWPTILEKVQNDAATKIQAVWKGYKYRRNNPEIVRRIKEAGRNYKQ